MAAKLPSSDLEIFQELFEGGSGELNAEDARAILNWRFSEKAQSRMSRLLRKNNAGTLTRKERIVLNRYVRIGKLVDVMKSKARVSLLRLNGQ